MLIRNNKEESPASRCFQMKRYAKRIVYGQCLNIVSSIVWGIWAAIFLQTHYERTAKYGNDIKLIYPIILTIQTTFIFFGPMACTAELVAGQIIETVTDLFCQWEDILECGSNGFIENMPFKSHSFIFWRNENQILSITNSHIYTLTLQKHSIRSITIS